MTLAEIQSVFCVAERNGVGDVKEIYVHKRDEGQIIALCARGRELFYFTAVDGVLVEQGWVTGDEDAFEYFNSAIRDHFSLGWCEQVDFEDERLVLA